MSAVISYPYISNTGIVPTVNDTYNQAQFVASVATISNSIIAANPPVNDAVLIYSSAVRVDFGANRMFVGSIVPGSSFGIGSSTSGDTSTINWLLLAETANTSFPNQMIYLPWYDNADPTQICGTITLGSGGQATLTSKYLTGSTEASARSRILLTLNTPNVTDFFPTFTLENYDPLTGSFTITSGSSFDRSTVNYFIITKCNHPYIPVSGSGTIIRLVSTGAARTYGIETMPDDDFITIFTTAVQSNSVILACMYTVSTPADVDLPYIQSSDINPGVSFIVRISRSPSVQSQISWLLIQPVGTP